MKRTKLEKRVDAAAQRRAQRLSAAARAAAPAPGADGAAGARAAGTQPPTPGGAAIAGSDGPGLATEAAAGARSGARAAAAATADAQAGAAPPQRDTEAVQKQRAAELEAYAAGVADADKLMARVLAKVAPLIDNGAARPEDPAQPPFRTALVRAYGGGDFGRAAQPPCRCFTKGALGVGAPQPRPLPAGGTPLRAGPVVPVEDMVPPLLHVALMNPSCEPHRRFVLSEAQQTAFVLKDVDNIRDMLRTYSTMHQRADGCGCAHPVTFLLFRDKDMHERYYEFRLSRELVIRMRLEAGWSKQRAEGCRVGSPSDDEGTSESEESADTGDESGDEEEEEEDDADDDASADAGKENAGTATQPSKTKLTRQAARRAARAAERAAARAAKKQEEQLRELERVARRKSQLAIAQRKAAVKAAKSAAALAKAEVKKAEAELHGHKSALQAVTVQLSDALQRTMRLQDQLELGPERARAGLPQAEPSAGAAPTAAASAVDSQITAGVAACATSPPPLAAAPAAQARAVAHAAPKPRCAQCALPLAQKANKSAQCLELCCDRGCRALLHLDCGCSAALGSVVLVWQDGARRRFKLDPALRCLTALAGGDAACDGVTVRARVLPAEPTVHNAADVKVLFDEREAAARREAAEAARIAAAAAAAPATPQRRGRQAAAKSQQLAPRAGSDGGSSDGARSPPAAAAAQVAVLNRAAPLPPQSQQAREAAPADAEADGAADAATPSAEHPPAAPAAAIAAMDARRAAAMLAELRRRTCDDAVTTSVLIELAVPTFAAALSFSSSPPRSQPSRAGGYALTAAAVVAAAARKGVTLSAADVQLLPPHAAAATVARLEDAVTLRTLMHGRCASALLPGAPAAKLRVSFLAPPPPDGGDRGADAGQAAAPLDAGPPTPPQAEAAVPAAPRGGDAGGAGCGSDDSDDAASHSGMQHSATPPQPSRWMDGILLALSSYELSFYAHAHSLTIPGTMLRHPITVQQEPTDPATALLLLDVLTGELHGVWAAVARTSPDAPPGVHFSRVVPLRFGADAALQHVAGDASHPRLRLFAPKLCGYAAARVALGVTCCTDDLEAEEVLRAEGYLISCAVRAARAARQQPAASVAATAAADDTEAFEEDGSELAEAVARVALFEADEALARALQAAEEEAPQEQGEQRRAGGSVTPPQQHNAPAAGGAALPWRNALLRGVA